MNLQATTAIDRAVQRIAFTTNYRFDMDDQVPRPLTGQIHAHHASAQGESSNEVQLRKGST